MSPVRPSQASFAATPPFLLVCHGLEGSSRAPHVRGLVARALQRGFSAAALDFRGCSGEINRLPRSYHSGETGDLAYAVARLAGEQSDRKARAFPGLLEPRRVRASRTFAEFESVTAPLHGRRGAPPGGDGRRRRSRAGVTPPGRI